MSVIPGDFILLYLVSVEWGSCGEVIRLLRSRYLIPIIYPLMDCVVISSCRIAELPES